MGGPDAVFAGGSIALWARLACFVPVIILVGFGVLRLLLLLPRGFRGLAIFAVCLAAAMLLPAALRVLPGWAIPDMWSDFSYWSSLAGQFESALRDLLGKAPYLRDVEGKLLLLRQCMLCFGGVLCSAAVCMTIRKPQNEKAIPFSSRNNSESNSGHYAAKHGKIRAVLGGREYENGRNSGDGNTDADY